MKDHSNEINRREPALRRAHAVIRQQVRLAYAAPKLVLLSTGAGEACEQSITLKAARTAQQLSIEDLSRRSHISLSTIYRIESGRTRPRAHVMHALSAALGYDPHQITEFCTPQSVRASRR